METLSGCIRFIVCIFSQSKPRGLNLFKIFFFFFFFFSVSLNYNNYSSHGFADVAFHYITVYGCSPFKMAFSYLPQ